jgi:hypothetical protein
VSFSSWDLWLITAVSSMGLAMALLPQPSAKAAVLTLPIPFSIAFLAVAAPVGVEHIAALVLLFAFAVSVWVLHEQVGLAIVPTITCAAGLYVLTGGWLRTVLSETLFWPLTAVVVVGASAFLVMFPPRTGVSHAPPAGLALKVLVLLVVSTTMVLLKGFLGGFMTLFPMVGVLAAYENRRHLWWNVRAVPIAALSLVVLLLTIRTLGPLVGPEQAVVLGWLPYGGTVFGLLVMDDRRRRATGEGGEPQRNIL